nr:hypothetical protein GCM10020093_114950 [Planobispora longispora]
MASATAVTPTRLPDSRRVPVSAAGRGAMKDGVRRTSTARPQWLTRSCPSATSSPRNPSAPMTTVGQLSGSPRNEAGTTNSESSGSPASALRRSRAEQKSTMIAISPTPPQVSRTIPALSGTGTAKRWMSAKPAATSRSSPTSDSLVGTTRAQASSPVNTAVR